MRAGVQGRARSFALLFSHTYTHNLCIFSFLPFLFALLFWWRFFLTLSVMDCLRNEIFFFVFAEKVFAYFRSLALSGVLLDQMAVYALCLLYILCDCDLFRFLPWLLRLPNLILWFGRCFRSSFTKPAKCLTNLWMLKLFWLLYAVIQPAKCFEKNIWWLFV